MSLILPATHVPGVVAWGSQVLHDVQTCAPVTNIKIGKMKLCNITTDNIYIQKYCAVLNYNSYFMQRLMRRKPMTRMRVKMRVTIMTISWLRKCWGSSWLPKCWGSRRVWMERVQIRWALNILRRQSLTAIQSYRLLFGRPYLWKSFSC